MHEPSVSVILPAYNCGQLLRQAVESVRRQTYEDFELIVVDDGSTDDTPAVIEELGSGWEKIRPVRAAHGGLAAARNRGIEAMRGEWIALLDADDLWLPEKLQRCMDYLRANPHLSIVYTPMKPIRMDGTPMAGHSKPCHAGRLTRALFQSIFIHDPAAVFHRRVIHQCGGFDESLPVCVGHEFWLRVSTKFEIGLIDEPLALRRWHEQSLTLSNRALGRRVKAAMLERFYFERGGDEFITRKEAFRRLSRVHYAAGKMLLRQRQSGAREFLGKAIRYRRWNLKAYPLYLVSLLGRLGD